MTNNRARPRTAMMAMIAALFMPNAARAEDYGSGYLALQRWLHAADVAANESVTYEICGWGFIDLRTSFLSAAIGQGVRASAWEELAQRYDNAVRERRRTEAALTAYGANPPMQRTSATIDKEPAGTMARRVFL